MPYCITATSGAGTSLGDNTFYEQGLYARPGQSGGNSGIPPHNTVFTARNNAGIQFLMPPDYTTNNDLMIDSSITTGTFTFATPVVATNLAVLNADGNGATTVNYTVNHIDGTTEGGSLSLLDWFTGGSTVAWGANGRITSGATYNNYNSSSVNNNAPYLYVNTITVSSNAAITNIVFSYASGAAHANFYAVSANAGGTNWTPAPVSGFNQISTVPATFPLTATMDQGAGTQVLNYQWQVGTNGVFVNLADGGRISGSKTSTLTLTNAQLADTASYQVVVTNSAGAVTSSTALLVVYSSTPDLTVAGDPISVFGGIDAAANGVTDAIDHTTTAWINYGANGAAPFTGPVGLVVTPSRGTSVVTGVRFYPGADSTDNDPVDYTLEGSNDGATFTPISASSVWLPNDRNAAGLSLNAATEVTREIPLANSATYTSYRLTFHNVRNPATAAGLEIGEVELIGFYAPAFTVQPVAAATRYAGGAATLTAAATDWPAPGYQWYVNGATALPGQTNSTLVLTNLALGQSGNVYTSVASNYMGAATSTGTLRIVIPRPVANYAAEVLADQPVAYWRLNETNVDLVNNPGNDGAVANDYVGGYSGTYSNASLQLPGLNPLVNPDTAAGFGTAATNNAPGFANDSFVDNIPLDFGTVSNAHFYAAQLAPPIIQAPTNTTVAEGTKATFAVADYGAPPLSYIGNFVASFTYQDTTVGGGGADGVAFVLQNDPAGTAALGNTGGGLGYARIVNSVALLLDIYTGNSQGGTGIAIGTNGVTPGDPGTIAGLTYTSASPVLLTDGNPVDVSLAYAAGVVNLRDGVRASLQSNQSRTCVTTRARR